VLAHVEPLDLLLRGDADAAGDGLGDVPEDHGRHEGAGAHHRRADQLRGELGHAAAEEEARLGDRGAGSHRRVGEEADGDGAEDAVGEVDGGGADRVVDLDLVEEEDGRDHQQAGDEADHQGAADADEGAGGGDGHQAGQAAVQGDAEVRLLQEDPGGDHRGDGAGGGRHVGGGGHMGDGGAIGRHGRARVEPEPAEPEYEHAEGCRGHVVAGRR
jgi:hypothetical protein